MYPVVKMYTFKKVYKQKIAFSCCKHYNLKIRMMFENISNIFERSKVMSRQLKTAI